MQICCEIKVGVYVLGVLRAENIAGEGSGLLAEIHYGYVVKILHQATHLIIVELVHPQLLHLPRELPYRVPALVGSAEAIVGHRIRHALGRVLPGDVAPHLQHLQQRGEVGLLVAGNGERGGVMHQLSAFGGEWELIAQHSILCDVHQRGN